VKQIHEIAMLKSGPTWLTSIEQTERSVDVADAETSGFVMKVDWDRDVLFCNGIEEIEK